MLVHGTSLQALSPGKVPYIDLAQSDVGNRAALRSQGLVDCVEQRLLALFRQWVQAWALQVKGCHHPLAPARRLQTAVQAFTHGMMLSASHHASLDAGLGGKGANNADQQRLLA